MKVVDGKLYAVLTGDIVGSSRLSSEQRVKMQSATTAAREALARAMGEAVSAGPEFYRGDGWQMVVGEPAQSLRVALFYRAALRSKMESHQFDTRMAIAIDTIDLVPEGSVLLGDGRAFRHSGRALESMKKRGAMRLVLPGRTEERRLDVVVQLIGAVAGRWSDRQALAITGALQGWTQAEIGKRWWKGPISQQAVAQHLDRASWSTVEVALSFFEATVAALAVAADK